MTARRMLFGVGAGPFSALERDLVALFNGTSDGITYGIGAGSRPIAGVWSPHGSNPIIAVGGGGAWDDATVKDPWLMWDGSQYVCFFAGLDGTNYRIGRATAAAHTGPWTKYGSNPIIGLGAGGSFDDAGCSFPTALHEPDDTGKEWKCWYAADDGAAHSIGYAYSSDGISWTKVGQVLTKGSSGTWEDESVLPVAIIKDGSTYYLFYGGRQGITNPRWQGGIATFTDPEGAYTKYPANPVLLARFNDAGTSQLLTTNTASGSPVVQVGSTAAWTVGEVMALIDDNSETDIHAIASVDSGTQITLDGNASSTFGTAGGATIRPAAYNAVLPRTVRRAPGGGFEMFGTAFQPAGDLSPGGTALRELSLRWTAPALVGPWSYDYATGLLFPLAPANSGWDKFSAENPSVIAAP